MNKGHVLRGVLSAGLVLVAAGSHAETPSAPMQVAQAAQPAPQGASRVIEKRTVTISPDGRTTRTETTRTSISYGQGHGRPAHAAPARALNMTGDWRIHNSSNKSTCAIRFDGAPNAASGRASTMGCAGVMALAGIDKWRYAQGQVSLYRMSGSVAVTLRRIAAGQYRATQGHGAFANTMTLYR
jgi:hypothetical protein